MTQEIKETFINANIGDVVTFGKFYKDNDYDMEPIEWFVLDKNDKEVFLLAKYGIEHMRYKDTYTSTSWSASDIRKWLNKEFLDLAFDKDEKKFIQYSEINSSENLSYDTNPGKDTVDRIFLLSAKEAKKYLTETNSICYPTKHAFSSASWCKGYSINDDGPYSWYLRTPGVSKTMVTVVDKVGKRNDYGLFATDTFNFITIRPAMRICLDGKATKPKAEKFDKEKLINANVGDRVSFGRYYINDDTQKDELYWKVLKKEYDRMLLITEDIVDTVRFKESNTPGNWKLSFLRKWLNGTFFSTAFNKSESPLVIKTDTSVDSNPDYPTPVWPDASDKVFVLSLSEINDYFDYSSDRKSKNTPFADQKRVKNIDGFGHWWVRTPGKNKNRTLCVDPEGDIDTYGTPMATFNIGIRPVIWVSIK